MSAEQAPSVRAALMSAKSADLVMQYAKIHRDGLYGQSSEFLLAQLQRQLVDRRLHPKRILDYGCGQSRLVDWISKLQDAVACRYDPAIQKYSDLPEGPFDLLINTDVLEHVPEDNLDNVLREMRSLSENAFIVVSTRPAGKVLPNGENAHCTVWPSDKWLEKISAYFPNIREINSLKNATCTFISG